MTDLMEAIARAIIRSKGADIVADDEHWPATIAHFREMEAEYGERYMAAGSLVNDAIRHARAALAAIDAAGFAVVPKEQAGVVLQATGTGPDFLAVAPSLCGCIKCTEARRQDAAVIREMRARGSLMVPGWRYACETCGNKRCPHHSDHTLACTGSNEPGQPGSVFAKVTP